MQHLFSDQSHNITNLLFRFLPSHCRSESTPLVTWSIPGPLHSALPGQNTHWPSARVHAHHPKSDVPPYRRHLRTSEHRIAPPRKSSARTAPAVDVTAAVVVVAQLRLGARKHTHTVIIMFMGTFRFDHPHNWPPPTDAAANTVSCRCAN